MSIISGLFGWAGAKEQSRAAERGIEASQQSTAETLGYLRETRDQTRADQEPWRQAGVSALGVLTGTPNQQQAAFRASPDYNFRVAEANKGLEAMLKSNGLWRSGAAVREGLELNGNLASGEWGNWLNQQNRLAGFGSVANTANQQAGESFASNAGNALSNNADVLRSSYQQQGNAWSGFYKDRGAGINNAMQNFFFGG